MCIFINFRCFEACSVQLLERDRNISDSLHPTGVFEDENSSAIVNVENKSINSAKR